jgi:hypothetical protein
MTKRYSWFDAMLWIAAVLLLIPFVTETVQAVLQAFELISDGS